MSVENPCFLEIFRECNKILKNSSDAYFLEKHSRLKTSCETLMQTMDTEYQPFYSVVTEIRTYDYLKTKGLHPIAHDDTSAGPDYICDLGYVECVCLTKGEPNTTNRNYIDKILAGRMNRNKAVLPRLSAAVKDKTEKYQKYITNDDIDNNRPRIIAVNTSIFSNAIHSKLIRDNMLKVLYGIGDQTMRFYPSSAHIKHDKSVETHTFDMNIRKSETNTFETGYFLNEKYSDISAIILENNSLTEKLSDDYFMVLINPLAKIKINEELLKNIKYFHYDSSIEDHTDFKWEIPQSCK